uniref:Energy transducer TonB n=1 Tax=Thermodesulfobacterium geofontis TaxID=1295609 RepID=A0A7C4JSZ0_9BACT
MIKLKEFFISFLIHFFFLLGFIVLFKLNGKSSAKYIEIDLSLINLAKLSEETSKVEKGLDTKLEKRLQTKAQSKTISSSSEEFKSPAKEVKESSFSENKEVKEVKEVNEVKEIANKGVDEGGSGREKEIKNVSMIKSGGDGYAGGSNNRNVESKDGGKGNLDELGKLREKFLIEKLSLISQIIQNNITYPYIARKMGWEGKVLISFVLTKEGKISFLNIEKSSGYKVLDENAIDTIKKVSKYFPLPPLDVKIKIPISYKLHNSNID